MHALISTWMITRSIGKKLEGERARNGRLITEFVEIHFSKSGINLACTHNIILKIASGFVLNNRALINRIITVGRNKLGTQWARVSPAIGNTGLCEGEAALSETE